MNKIYETLNELDELLLKDIKKVVDKGDITPPDYQCLDTAIDILKDSQTIKAMIESGYGEAEVSGMASGRMMPRNSYADGNGGGNSGYMPPQYNSWDDGMSYARGRSPMTGRYVSRDDEVTSKLGHMMQTANSEQERQMIGRLMNEIGR